MTFNDSIKKWTPYNVSKLYLGRYFAVQVWTGPAYFVLCSTVYDYVHSHINFISCETQCHDDRTWIVTQHCPNKTCFGFLFKCSVNTMQSPAIAQVQMLMWIPLYKSTKFQTMLT